MLAVLGGLAPTPYITDAGDCSCSKLLFVPPHANGSIAAASLPLLQAGPHGLQITPLDFNQTCLKTLPPECVQCFQSSTRGINTLDCVYLGGNLPPHQGLSNISHCWCCSRRSKPGQTDRLAGPGPGPGCFCVFVSHGWSSENVHPCVQKSCTRAAPCRPTAGFQEAPWLLHTSPSRGVGAERGLHPGAHQLRQ